MPESYQLTINGNHPVIYKLLQTEDNNTKKSIAKQLVDLAKLAQGMLKGKELNNFIYNSIEVIEKAEKAIK
jgi:molecular chaperone HtpG